MWHEKKQFIETNTSIYYHGQQHSKSIKFIIKKNTHQLQDRGYFWGRRVENGKRERYKGLGLFLNYFPSRKKKKKDQDKHGQMLTLLNVDNRDTSFFLSFESF